MHGIVTRTRTAVVAAVAVATTFGVAGIAAADDVVNNVDATVDPTAEQVPLNVGGPTRTVTLFLNPTNGDGKNGCNLTAGSTLVVSVASSSPGVATASLSNTTFTACGDTKTVTVTPVAVGSTTVTVSQVSNNTGATFNFTTATFQVTVAPPANTAPEVSVTGVGQGDSYPKGAVPAAGCAVTDAEDGPSSPTPTYSDTLDADGIGSETATCSYTDAGGLTTVRTATYFIVDPTKPVITYTLTPAEPDGLNGWWTGDPVLDWTVTDADSPSSLVLDGCDDVTIDADQDATDYSCSATSSGGTTDPVTVTVSRDGTGPAVSYVDADGTLGDDGWYVSLVTATFAASDALSGVDPDNDTATSTEDGAAVVIDSPAFNDNAGNTTAPGYAQSPSFKIDTAAPSVSDAELLGTKGNGLWWLSPVTATFTADDATSGVLGDDTGSASTGDDEGEVTLSSPQFRDVAGNVAAAGTKQAVVHVDLTAPAVTFVKLAGLEGNDGWYRSNVTGTYAGSDGVSGIDGDDERDVSSDHDGVYDLDSPAFSDVAGNTTGAGHVKTPIKVDTVAPSVGAPTLSGDEGDNGWFLGTVLATFMASDDTSGVAGDNPRTVSSEADQGEITLDSPEFQDVAGNTTPAGSRTATFKVDSVAPSVAFTKLAGTSGNAGWYTSPVTVTYTATDNTSGVAGDNPVDVSSGVQEGSFDVESPAFSDNAGNTTDAGAVQTPVKVDTVPPSVTFTKLSGDEGNENWYLSPVTATFTAEDGTSGVAGGNPRDVASGDQEGEFVLESPAFDDVAGNTTPAGADTVQVKVDTVAPAVGDAQLSGTHGDGVWWISEVTASFLGTDLTSGIRNDDNPQQVRSGDAQGPVTLVSPLFQDVAGNGTPAGAKQAQVWIDTVAPSVELTGVTGDEGDENWFTSAVTATFTAADETSGVAGPNPRDVSSGAQQGLLELDSPEFKDEAGNTTAAGAAQADVKVDSVAPAVGDAVLSGTQGSNGWYTSDVTASFAVTDATSGVVGDNPRVVSSGGAQGDLTLVSPEVRDVAGNVTGSGAKSQAVKIDTVAPSVSLVGGPASGSSHYFGSVPAAPTCTASDATSGIGVDCVVTGYGTGVGSHTVTATVTDRAGNTSTSSRTYQVAAWTGKGFYSPVDMNDVWNKVKGGSTVPLKFELFAGPTELTSTASIASFGYRTVQCDNSAPSDEIEMLTSGSTSLRYDATGGQFIQNWKVPAAVGCYRATMTALDGTTISALFKVTK